MTTSRRGRAAREFVPPVGAVAAIFIGATQCEFQHRRGSEFTSKQVTPSTLRLAFSEEPIDTGWLAEGVVRWGKTPAGVFSVGYYPPARYRFSVLVGRRMRRLHAPMPALVFAGVGINYYVWAMKGKRLDPKGELFRAPLPNLNELGLICFGANSHPDVHAGGFGPSWKMFWESPFTDHHARGRSRAAMGDVREHLLELSRARATAFPQSALIPAGVTLEAAVDRLVNRERSR